MHILYIGNDNGTSRHRHLAMTRAGHQVSVVDPHQALPRNRLISAWSFKSGNLGLSELIRRYVNSKASDHSYDLVWVDHGDLCSRALIQDLKRFSVPIVNYNQDNPYVDRDGRRWRLFINALPEYDLIATPRASSALAAADRGARSVLRVMFAADEKVHSPQVVSPDDREKYGSQVAFVGTWMPERGPFMKALVERNVPLTIFGPRWEKAPEYRFLSSHVRAGHLESPEYVKVVQSTAIALGMLSKGNEDLHTTRSIEIPAIGSVLCAERTPEHLEMYAENEEAVFWETAEECADLCLSLLADPLRLQRIAKAGYDRAQSNGYFNERLVAQIVEAAQNQLDERNLSLGS
jgi:spore maturation protein CgeB